MAMHQEDVPRNLTERSGVHICVRCLREVGPEEFYRNDHVCARCAEEADAALAGGFPPPDRGGAGGSGSR